MIEQFASVPRPPFSAPLFRFASVDYRYGSVKRPEAGTDRLWSVEDMISLLGYVVGLNSSPSIVLIKYRNC